MGIIILNFIILVEVTFACYCLATKSYQFKTLGLLKIGIFAALTMLALTSIIELDLRWLLLGMVLLIRAIVGGITLAVYSKKDASRNFKPFRVVFRALVRLAIISIALSPMLLTPGQNPILPTGNYPVLTREVTYRDASRVETLGSGGGNTFYITYAPQISGADQSSIEHSLKANFEIFKVWLEQYFAEKEAVSFA